ncbi:homoserine O-acetyltransferase family protein [Olivibacter sitiensis]|uniref:homoserine O-acetyltransferase family protein n=1 Tax=Olivibacter sitiensis TaxID=376470 RepID=UPI0004867981|nr:homoserine O-acetyltransferase [Olivibacter sitiensis]
MGLHIYQHNAAFTLKNGEKLEKLKIAYHTFGKLNANRNNVVWVCHALTANSNVMDWWPGLFGNHDFFNPEDYFIVCANILGSHYGTTSPLSENPKTGLSYYLSFPQITIRDMVSAHQLLASHLGIKDIEVLIGGSLGGQQAVEWAIDEPQRIKHLILMATNAQHSPWGIAFNESQRLAISSDRTFYANHPDGGKKGLKAARSIALLSYRTYVTYGTTQMEVDDDKLDHYKASSYQNYQGDKLVNRYNAYSYWYLSKAMDSHHVGRNRKSTAIALSKINAKTLVIGITTDLLFPLEEQQYLAQHIPLAKFVPIDSFYGHDGFLIETKLISKEIADFLKKNRPAYIHQPLQTQH